MKPAINGSLKTIEQFASETGISSSVVTHWVYDDKIPSVKIGKRRLINVYKLVTDLLIEERKKKK